MNKMKTIVLVIATLLVSNICLAQTVEEGKMYLYYERYKSSKEAFQKIVAANPSDEVANYYLGQAMIGLEDIAGAKALYQQKMAAMPNSPLLLAGMGHIGLLEQSPDAKSRFETAVNLAQGKRIDVLNAVSAPNSDPDIINGDASFAADKLNLATTIKGFKDPEVWANLGDAYRKLGDGGKAIRAYDAALALNPNYARAIYRKGRLYQSQGLTQEPLYISFYNDAIAKDAKYAPVYNTLFNYYYETNVTKAADYLEKALAVSDEDPSACYKRASIKFAQKLFTEAITLADGCIAASPTNTIPNLYGVKAYSYSRLNDTVNAKKYFEEFFSKQIPSKIGSGDYTTYATILLKFAGNEALAGTYIDKAVAIDTLEANKIMYLKQMATYFKERNNYADAAAWYNKILYIKANYGVSDLYNAGYNYFRVSKYDSSITVFKKYAAKYPDDMFGSYMIAKNIAAGSDSTMEKGLGAEAYLKAVEIGERAIDKNKIKDYLVGAYTYLLQYSFNIKKDQAAAIAYADKALLVDSLNEQSIKNKDFVTKNNPTAIKPTTKPATKPTVAKPGTIKPKPAAPVKKK